MVNKNSISKVLSKVPKNLKSSFYDVLTKICQAHIFVPKDYNELNYLKKVRKLVLKKPNIRVLVIHLTDYCNLHCKYCFIEKNIPRTYTRKNMSKKVIERSIDKFGKIIKNQIFLKPPSIVFYGGEPLINWDILKHGLEYLQEKQQAKILPSKIEKILITNGTLINYKIADVLKKHNVLVSVSIDGPEKIHNFNRLFKNGKGSFKEAINGFQILKEKGIRPTVSCVLSKQSLKYASSIINWLINNLKITALGFNHVSIIPNIFSYDPIYENNFADALIKTQEIIQDKYPQVYERRMNHKINCFLERQIIRADCTGCGEQMSISPDGKIGICQGYMGSRKTFGASVFDSKYNPQDDSVFIEWTKRSPLNMSQCWDCPALATCGGGCPRNADFINGSIWEIDSAFCHFAKKAQEWMIWKKYEAKQR